MASEELNKQLRILQLISFGLIAGVIFFAVVVVFMIQQGVGSTTTLDIPMPLIAAVALVVLLAAPQVTDVIRNRAAKNEEDALQNFFNSCVVAQAVREGVGLMGIVFAFVMGDLMWVLIFATVTAATMLVGLPNRSVMEEVVRKHRSGR